MSEQAIKALDEAENKIDEARRAIAARWPAGEGTEKDGEPDAIVKFEVPAKVYHMLRVVAAERRVTVKYLFLEMLSQGGYPVDMSTVPTDGRRVRT